LGQLAAVVLDAPSAIRRASRVRRGGREAGRHVPAETGVVPVARADQLVPELRDRLAVRERLASAPAVTTAARRQRGKSDDGQADGERAGDGPSLRGKTLSSPGSAAAAAAPARPFRAGCS